MRRVSRPIALENLCLKIHILPFLRKSVQGPGLFGFVCLFISMGAFQEIINI